MDFTFSFFQTQSKAPTFNDIVDTWCHSNLYTIQKPSHLNRITLVFDMVSKLLTKIIITIHKDSLIL